MSVRVPALHGHAHRPGCQGDCCHYDKWTDELATGDPFDLDYRPPMGTGFKTSRPSRAAANPAHLLDAMPGSDSGARRGTFPSSPSPRPEPS